jgi:hypothetical protein
MKNDKKMTHKTAWTPKMGLAIWNYQLDFSKASKSQYLNPHQRAIALKDIVFKLLFNTLDDFAKPQKATISTTSIGEDSFVFYLNSPKSIPKFVRKLEQTQDVNNIEIDLTLECLELAEGDRLTKKLEIPLGAYISISVELDDEGNLDLSSEEPVSLNFCLNVDIYAPIKLSREDYNDELAQLNRPKLTNFLRRLEADLPVEFVWFDAPDYEEFVGRYGFNLISNQESKTDRDQASTLPQQIIFSS